ncbi:hypothetical protein M426DRAFT_55767 [Hypoxylon sp. CI-4A]|nr:hypothetical protein M426DRAFT_55767 [Hypoxylon sp. CI-4A]
MTQHILEDIAIVGTGLRFPGDATDPEAFYDMLLRGRSALTETPADRYNLDSFYHPDQERLGAVNVRHAHYLKGDIAAFDAPFFSITPNEAVYMDPQQRGLLETVYHALENSGIPLENAVGSKTSVHIGCFTREYDSVMARDPEIDLKYIATGTGTALLANRLSWFYDLRGPSLTLDSACSSSLNAVHLGCQALKSGEVNMAVAGGCNLFYNPDTMVPLTSLGFLSPDGKCHTFDSKANGYSRGEGFGVVILKRMSDAVRDGDVVRAVIRATSSNQDGRSPGITQPTRQGQVELIREAYDKANLDFGVTRYFEAHGTGTNIGDPIEASAISDVFTPHRSTENPMYVGALKTNIGHLEGAAGIAGLIKAVSVLETGIIPSNLWFEEVNPKIPAHKWHLKFPTQPTPWPQDGLRRASVNSFGYGGSNAHAVLDDARHYMLSRQIEGQHRTVSSPKLADRGLSNGSSSDQRTAKGAQNRLFLLSANDEDGVRRVTQSYHGYLERQSPFIDDEDSYLNDLAYTLQSKRSQLSWRAGVVATGIESLKTALLGTPATVRPGTAGRLALVFTGQGAQWPEMGRELLRFPIFKHSLDNADKYLKKLGCSWSLVSEQLKHGTLQVALVELLRSWSVPIGAVIGHSSGEIAAAFATGAISRESAWRIAYYRGKLSSQLEGSGAMLAVALAPQRVAKYIDEVCSNQERLLTIACFNSPKSVTVSGNPADIGILQTRLDQDSVFNRRLKVTNAYHSAYMQKIAVQYQQLIGDVESANGYGNGDPLSAVAYYSSLTGDYLPLHRLQMPSYWVDNLICPVRFSEASLKLLSDKSSPAKGVKPVKATSPITEILEVGPHGALQGPLREVMESISGVKDIAYKSMLTRNRNADDTVLSAMCWLWCRGQPVDLQSINNESASPSPSKMLVDLPPYPFNHSKSYWKESRLSKGYRFRKHPRLELLGAPVPDWSQSNAIWRNWIRLSENPWIKDHRVTGSLLYPGAGMLVMAIEASRQLLDPKKTIKGFRMKEVVFQTALRIPTNADGIETHFYVRPYFDSTASASSSWNEFQLSSHDGDEWRDHCRGLIQPDYETPTNVIDNGDEERLFLQHFAESAQDAEEACTAPISSKQLYELLRTTGFDFGETFQTLYDVSIDKNQGAVATIKAPNIKSKMPLGYVQPHLIHPTTLDGVIQSVIVALTRGGREVRDAMVPTSIHQLWISAASDDKYSTLKVCSKAERLGLRQATASVAAMDPGSGKPLITIDGLVSTAIASRSSDQQETRGAHHHLCFNIDWKPDVTSLRQESFTKLLPPPEELARFNPTELIADVEAICYAYLRRHMKANVEDYIPEAKPWYLQYISWAKYQLARHDRRELMHDTEGYWDRLVEDDAAFAKLEAKLENSSPEAKLSVVVGRALPDILCGKADPLEIFFTNSLMEDVYSHGTGAEICYSHLSNYIDLLAHKHSDLVILEVGAGTGGATVPILNTLARHGEAEVGAGRFKRYDFTDISPSFFEMAKETFKKTADRMRFQTLNIEKDPLEQDFQPEQYDVIIAGNVVHATKNIDVTLRNLRKLLKPGGKLILHELTNPSMIRTGFGFGLLPGWWLSEESHRSWGPLMSASGWTTHLKRSGFTGVDQCFEDYPDEPNKLNSIIISTGEGSSPEARTLPPTVIIVDGKSEFQDSVAEIIRRNITALGDPDCNIVKLHELDHVDLAQKLCIVLADVEGGSLLRNIDETKLKALQKMTTVSGSIVWLTLGGGPAADNPNGEMLTGFARVMRQENPALNFITIAIEQLRSAFAVAETTLNIIDSTMVKKTKDVTDNSFYESGGVIYISRLVEASYMNDAIALKTSQPTAQEKTFGDESDPALRLVIGSPGLLDSLQFVHDEVYDEPVPEGYVEFKVEAAGLNFLDIMIALGQVIGNDLGVEGSGIVTRTGPNSRFKPGDRVCGIAAGTFSTYARAMETSIAKIPDNLSFRAAAGLAVVFVTAYSALYSIANIQPGESVLIHAAAGGVGQACIQLAKVRGAEIYATVGSVEKRDLLIDTYGIPKDHIFSSRDLVFAQGIKRMTKGHGVDVAVNSLSGDALRATWDCIAPFGRFVEVGKVDIYSAARLNMEQFKNNVSFEFVDISFLAKNKGHKFSAIMEDLMNLVRAGRIGQLHPTQAFKFGEMHEAFRYMQSGAHSGKIIMEPHVDDIVPVVPQAKNVYDFDPAASFVISGGLGGLGRSIAKWMAARGAKYIILLSRSGNTKSTSRELIAELESMGVVVAAPQCDVSDVESLRSALNDCYEKGMPQVKGCIQGSMVLKDGLFENMSLENYYAAVKPKLHASWNLHNVLPRDLDFFILLSSIATILGNRGQSNYNVGNSFQDALARYRVSNGLKATALDLGMILSVGYVAENDSDLVTHLRDVGVEPIREEEFHAVLNELCNPHLPPQPLIKAQITLGLQMPETRMATGAEEPGWMRDPLFKHLHRIRTLEGGADLDGKNINYGVLLAAADSFDAAVDIVYDALVQKLVKVLNIGLDDVDPTKPMHALGVDSLIAVELRTWMLKQLDADVAVFDLMEVSSIRALAGLIASRSNFVTREE